MNACNYKESEVTLQVEEQFVAVCDVLGFKERLVKDGIFSLASRYNNMLKELKNELQMHIKKINADINEVIYEHKKFEPIAFSDTILLWSGPLERDPWNIPMTGIDFIGMVDHLFGIALRNDLPLRVGIAYGECIISPASGIYIGQPIVDAYLTEEAQNWIGIACHSSCLTSPGGRNLCPKAPNGWQVGPLVEYEIPLKPNSLSLAQHSTDWPRHCRIFFDSESGVEDYFSHKVVEYAGSIFEERWARTLEYCRLRLDTRAFFAPG